MMKVRCLLMVVGIALCHSGFSQVVVKNNITRVSLRNSGSITEQGQVRGYYSFYDLEQTNLNSNNYQLVLYDENLREINSINIVRSRTYGILDGAFNGKAFCFLFYDYKKKVTEMVSYDSALRQTGLSIAPVTNKFSKRQYKVMVQNNLSGEYLIAVPDKGFMKYGLRGEKALYQLEFFDNQMKKRWSAEAPGKFKYEEAANSFLQDDYVGSAITSTNNGSGNIEKSLIVHRIQDGTTLFNIPLVTKHHNISFSKVYFDQTQQKFIVIGEYYNKIDNVLKAQSLGFTVLTLDMEGKIVDQKLNSWADMSKVAPVTAEGKFDGSNVRMVFHDIVRTSDGQFFVVGEQYAKAISGAGIAAQGAGLALAVLTGTYISSASSVQLNIYNMVVLHFNADLSLNKVHLFEKSKTSLQLPPGSSFTSSKQLSAYAKMVDGFDYAYTQTAADGNSFVVAYINFEKGGEKGIKSSNVLGSIIYTPEKVFTVDKMPLNRKSSVYRVYEAKEGYVLITEYFQKEKRVESRLEKLNY